MGTMPGLARFPLVLTLLCTPIIQAHAQNATAPLHPGKPPWTKITGQDCWMYGSQLTDQTVTWTGSCSEGRASGPGTATWRDASGAVIAVSSGTRVDGELQGHVLYETYKDGKRAYRFIGNVINGIQNGQGYAATYAEDGTNERVQWDMAKRETYCCQQCAER